MRGWLRLVVIGLSVVSIVSAITSCKLLEKKATTETKPAVEEAEEWVPVEEEE